MGRWTQRAGEGGIGAKREGQSRVRRLFCFHELARRSLCLVSF